MSWDKLQQVLLRQRQDFAPLQIVDMIAEVLDADPALVSRVVFAYAQLLESTRLTGPLRVLPFWAYCEELVPDEVRAALSEAMRNASHRWWFATHIESEGTMNVETSHLIGETSPQICDGCADFLRCTATNLSTPEDCITKHRAVSQVRVLELKGTTATVESEQPKGRFTVDIRKVSWQLEYKPDPFAEKK